MKKFLVWLMLLSMPSCTSPAPIECVWVRKIVASPDDLISRRTAEQIVAHNRKVEAFCRRDASINASR